MKNALMKKLTNNEAYGDEKKYSPDEVTSIAASTIVKLHTVHNAESKATSHHQPISSRIHIAAPNPTATHASNTLATPHHVCCVIDISKSMCGAAKSKDEDGNYAEDYGLSILDIVKFSTLVISQSLNGRDKLSIVTYSDEAEIALAPTNMTEKGKERVKNVLDVMEPVFRTNLFAGLQVGVQQANAVGKNYVNSIFILTDGVPNIHPPNSYEKDIAELLSIKPVFGSISTFGFGYQLDSKLLVDIATMGGGYYSFIPDAGMVGTCFINALANSQCAYGVQPVLKIKGCDYRKLKEVGIIVPGTGVRWRMLRREKMNVTAVTLDERYETTIDGSAICVKLPPLRYGSNVDVMLKPQLFRNADNISIELTFHTVGGGIINLPVMNTESNAAEDLFHSTRVQFVKDAFFMSFDAYRNDATSRNTFLTSTTKTKTSPHDPNLDALTQDMKGQATEAIADNKCFATWGKHYLLSLSNAHLHQFCNNYKDPGVQIYGKGHLFGSLQDSLDDIFEKVPPPVPSRGDGAGGAPVQMSRVFNNQNAVCVRGETHVTTYNESTNTIVEQVAIRDVKKGDFVLAANGTYFHGNVERWGLIQTVLNIDDNTKWAKVECLVETRADKPDEPWAIPPFELVKIGDLCITPYHPIKLDHKSDWQWPISTMSPHDRYNVLPPPRREARSVYNLVLERGQRHYAVLMDGIQAITLGHGITNNATLQHDYFGTDSVVADLEKANGWMEGHVVLKESDMKRDPFTNCISRISGEEYDKSYAEGITCA